MAFNAGNFKEAWAAVEAQAEAVRASLFEASPPLRGREPWANSCPMDDLGSSDGEADEARASGFWPAEAAAQRGQGERSGAAAGAWPCVAASLRKGLAAEADAEATGADPLLGPPCSGSSSGGGGAAAKGGGRSGL